MNAADDGLGWHTVHVLRERGELVHLVGTVSQRSNIMVDRMYLLEKLIS